MTSECKGGELDGIGVEYVTSFPRLLRIKHNKRIASAASATTPPTAIPAIAATERVVEEPELVWLGEEDPDCDACGMLAVDEGELELRQEASFEPPTI